MNQSNHRVLALLQHLIEQNAVQQVLYLGNDAPPLAEHAQCTLQSVSLCSPPSEAATLEQIAGFPHSDLVIAGDAMQQFDREQGLQVLAALRNHLQARICLLAPEPSPWQFTDLIGLGFKRLARCERDAQVVTLYSYAISDYNFTREWNNSRFWANPEMFGKYWW